MDSKTFLARVEEYHEAGWRLALINATTVVSAPAPAHGAAAPLAADGAPSGVLAVACDEAFTGEHLETLGALGRLAGLRLRELTAERRCIAEYCATQADIADRLQRKLLPQSPPELEGLDVAFSYRSATAGVLSGGDFMDFYSRSPGTLAFAIGDVAGKGVDAMAVTFVTKYVLRAAVHGGQLSWPTHPGEALQELRTALLEQPGYYDDNERFVTVLFGTLSVARRLLQLASAGHPTPFIVRAGGVERPLLLTEPAIGVELGAALAPYPQETVELREGDVVVFFTDGLGELRDADDTYFEDVLADVLAECHDLPAAEVVERLMRAGEEFSARPPADDLTVLCIHVTAAPEVH
jgi:phosphoserine phosphatase RsbU/P